MTKIVNVLVDKPMYGNTELDVERIVAVIPDQRRVLFENLIWELDQENFDKVYIAWKGQEVDKDDDRLGITRKEFEKELILLYKSADEVQYRRGYQKAVDDACKWMEENLNDYAGEDSCRNSVPFDKNVFEDFRKALEKQIAYDNMDC